MITIKKFVNFYLLLFVATSLFFISRCDDGGHEKESLPIVDANINYNGGGIVNENNPIILVLLSEPDIERTPLSFKDISESSVVRKTAKYSDKITISDINKSVCYAYVFHDTNSNEKIDHGESYEIYDDKSLNDIPPNLIELTKGEITTIYFEFDESKVWSDISNDEEKEDEENNSDDNEDGEIDASDEDFELVGVWKMTKYFDDRFSIGVSLPFSIPIGFLCYLDGCYLTKFCVDAYLHFTENNQLKACRDLYIELIAVSTTDDYVIEGINYCSRRDTDYYVNGDKIIFFYKGLLGFTSSSETATYTIDSYNDAPRLLLDFGDGDSIEAERASSSDVVYAIGNN